ncbi:MAG: TatD family hydrolase, partial [Candidatus Hodarchaeota archaeon]
MLIDSHCHLDWKSFNEDIDLVIKRAKDNGLVAIITSSFSDNFEKTLKYVEKFKKYVFISLGLHPPQVNINSVKRTIKLIQENANKIKAIGEVGLDYYWVKDPKKREGQQKGFVKFINLSKELKLPIVIHARNAHKDAIDILENNSAINVLMHCFSGKEIEV